MHKASEVNDMRMYSSLLVILYIKLIGGASGFIICIWIFMYAHAILSPERSCQRSVIFFTSRAEGPERYYNHEGGRPAGRALLHVSRFLKKYLSYDHEILHTLRVPWEDVLRIFW